MYLVSSPKQLWSSSLLKKFDFEINIVLLNFATIFSLFGKLVA